MPYPDLFEGKLTTATQLAGLEGAEALELVRQMTENTDPALLQAFFPANGLVDIMENPTTNAISPGGNNAQPPSTKVADIGAVLGYLFSRQPITDDAPTLTDNLLPIGIIYTVLINRLLLLKEGKTLSMVSFFLQAGTKIFSIGSTLPGRPDWGTEAYEHKSAAQLFRQGLLAQALGGRLPPVPPKLEFAIVQYMLEHYLWKGALEKSFWNPLKNWVNKPPGMAKSTLGTWNDKDYLGWLYLQLCRSLIGGMTRKLKLQKRVDLGNFNDWRAKIVALIADNIKSVDPDPVSNVMSTSVDLPAMQILAITTVPANPPNMLVIKDALTSLLDPDRIITHLNSKKWTSIQLYGHCAETYPVIKFATLGNGEFSGLAIKPDRVDEVAANVEHGTAIETDLKKRAFEYPCTNCRGLIRILGMTDDQYNGALAGVPGPETTLLLEYILGYKNAWVDE